MNKGYLNFLYIPKKGSGTLRIEIGKCLLSCYALKSIATLYARYLVISIDPKVWIKNKCITKKEMAKGGLQE